MLVLLMASTVCRMKGIYLHLHTLGKYHRPFVVQLSPEIENIGLQPRKSVCV